MCTTDPEAVMGLVDTLISTIADQQEEMAEFKKQLVNQQKENEKLDKRLDKLQHENRGLRDRMGLLEGENGRLKKRVKELEGQLKLNSRNSSKPPSSDGFSKPPTVRKKTGKPPGGRPGHEGHTLQMVESPDHTVIHTVSECFSCGRSLERVATTDHERRQVFDLPPVKVEVTEHRAERKTCPRCGSLSRATFPEGVTQPVQYGPRAKAVAIYLNAYQLLPYERAGELMSDLFGCPVSQATLVNATRAASETLKPVEDEIKRLLADSPVANFDETGMRVEGRGSWLHVASTERLTHYGIHHKRGRKATDDIGILPGFTGTAVHDCWSPYFTYGCSHALCNAHLIRELTFQAEENAQEWALDMKELLLDAYAAVNEAKARGSQCLKRRQVKEFEKSYERILARGFAANPLPDTRCQPRVRGRRKKTKARNLLERLRDYQCEVLAFMNDFSVPFTNNLAEADLRMAKVKQKISGTFRSRDGARDFCRIRGYISTARKNSVPAIGALVDVFLGKPFVPGAAET